MCNFALEYEGEVKNGSTSPSPSPYTGQSFCVLNTGR